MQSPMDIGKGFLDKVFAALPEDKREEYRSEYSRAQDQFQSAVTNQAEDLEEQRQKLEAWRQQLHGWKQTTESQLAAKARALQQQPPVPQPNPGEAPPVAQPATSPPNGVTEERLAEMFDHFGRSFVGVTDEVLGLMYQHQQLYPGQRLDTLQLYAHPLAKTQGLSAAYQEIHKEKITAAATAAREAAEAKIREDERAKVLAEVTAKGNGVLPFPTPGDDTSAMGLLAARSGDQNGQYGADAAAALFNQMRLNRPA